MLNIVVAKTLHISSSTHIEPFIPVYIPSNKIGFPGLPLKKNGQNTGKPGKHYNIFTGITVTKHV